MKAAVLIQGDARFCREFDLFLENLKGFDQVDYFMYLWKNNYTTADLLGRNGHVVVFFIEYFCSKSCRYIWCKLCSYYIMGSSLIRTAFIANFASELCPGAWIPMGLRSTSFRLPPSRRSLLFSSENHLTKW